MMGEWPEVLVVDDSIRAASGYAELIELRCSLRAVATDDPDEALNFIRKYPIRVVVLDQGMPKMSGTELFERLQALNPFIHAIMLSGQAGAGEVAKAYDLGFSDYLHKSDISKLPEKVFQGYSQFELDSSKNATQGMGKLLRVVRAPGSALFGSKLHYRLQSIAVLSEAFVFPDSWRTVAKINAGESITVEEFTEFTREVVVSDSVETRMSSELGIAPSALQPFKASLATQINAQLKTVDTSKSLARVTKKVEYKLPSQPDDPHAVYVNARSYEVANVYVELRCTITRLCTACTTHHPVSIVVYHPTRKVASRQTDYLSDQTQRIVDTGAHQYL